MTCETQPSFAKEFETLRSYAELVAERQRLGPYLTAPPDKTLALVAEIDIGGPELREGEVVVYACPMHADDGPEQEPRHPQRERENRGEGGKLRPTPSTSI